MRNEKISAFVSGLEEKIEKVIRHRSKIAIAIG